MRAHNPRPQGTARWSLGCNSGVCGCVRERVFWLKMAHFSFHFRCNCNALVCLRAQGSLKGFLFWCCGSGKFQGSTIFSFSRTGTTRLKKAGTKRQPFFNCDRAEAVSGVFFAESVIAFPKLIVTANTAGVPWVRYGSIIRKPRRWIFLRKVHPHR